MRDRFHLTRFVNAQNDVYNQVLTELRRGRKDSCWMWFVFPQIEGLGRSDTAKTFAISSKSEAETYIRHPVLGPRLIECTRLVNAVNGKTIVEILGYTDALKFRSSVTLFQASSGDASVFTEALQKYFDGVPDAATLTILKKSA